MPPTLAGMNLEQALYGRTSVRAYAPTPVNEATLQTLLAAAVRAPTAMHEEPWQFLVIQDRARLRQLSDRAKAQLSAGVDRLHPDHRLDRLLHPEFNLFYDAGTLLVICSRTAGPFAQADGWLAAQNLMLAAHALGLGSCVIGSALGTLNTPEVRQELGLPADLTAVAPIILGYPRETPRPSARQAPRIAAWIKSDA